MNRLASLHGRLEAYFGERAIDEIVQGLQAAIEESSGTAADGNGAAFENAERQHRGIEVVAQLVRESPQALGSLVGQGLLAQSPVLRDGLGDGVVETAVQRVKFVDRDLRVELECQLGYGLAQVAVVVNHLAHAEPQAKHVVAMLRRARGPFRRLGGVERLQRVDELVEKQRDSVGELCFGCARSGSRCDLCFGPRDDLGALRFEELV